MPLAGIPETKAIFSRLIGLLLTKQSPIPDRLRVIDHQRRDTRPGALAAD